MREEIGQPKQQMANLPVIGTLPKRSFHPTDLHFAFLFCVLIT